MADSKISELTELTSPAVDDVLPITDVTATATTKKITVSNLNFFNPYKARAYGGNAQTINDNSATQIQLNSESYDPNNNFDTSTYTYTVPVTGYYQVNARVFVYDAQVKIYTLRVYLKINGNDYTQSVQIPASVSAGENGTISDIIYLTAGNTITLYAFVDTTDSGTVVTGTTSEAPYMSIHLLSI